MRAGCCIGDGAVIDRQFGTTDVFIYFPLSGIDAALQEPLRAGEIISNLHPGLRIFALPLRLAPSRCKGATLYTAAAHPLLARCARKSEADMYVKGH